MIDFEIPEDAKKLRERVRAFVHEECIPVEERLVVDHSRFDEELRALRAKAREQGLWCPFIPEEWAGWGFVRSRMRSYRWNSGRVVWALWRSTRRDRTTRR